MNNRKPRVVLLHYTAPPTIGGVEVTLAAHARLLADHGYAVKIVAGRGALFDPRVRLEILADADSTSPRVLEVNGELARGIVAEKFHTLARDLTRALENALADCSVLLAHNVLSLHKNLALTAALKNLAHIPIVAWCHDFAWTDPQYAPDLHPGLPWELLKQPWPEVKYVVVSEARRKELMELWSGGQIPNLRYTDIAVVPPGIDACEFFGVTEQTARWVYDLALLDAAPLLLLPARVTRRKKIERAIEITAALRERGLKAKLVVTGPPGPHNPTNVAYLEKLRNLRQTRGVEDAVIFLYEFGGVDDATRRDLFLLADVLLFPSEREGFGIPLLEAGLARLPIFCADLPPLRESARTHAHYFAPDETAPAIAARLADFCAHDSAYQLKQRTLREYAWERIFRERIEPLVRGG